MKRTLGVSLALGVLAFYGCAASNNNSGLFLGDAGPDAGGGSGGVGGAGASGGTTSSGGSSGQAGVGGSGGTGVGGSAGQGGSSMGGQSGAGTGGASGAGGSAGTDGGDGGSAECAALDAKLTMCNVLGPGRTTCEEPAPTDEFVLCANACVLNASCADVTERFCEVDGPVVDCIRACGMIGGFDCGDGSNVPSDWQCDGFPDCENDADENGCPEFACADSLFSVPEAFKCDGDMDCLDGSDELGCPTFSCTDGSMVPAPWECDGLADCADGSDETGCAELTCPVPEGGTDGGTGDASTDGGSGVTPDTAGQLVITEIMQNPAAVVDSMGEWLEIHNPASSTTTFSLLGCVLRDDDIDSIDITADVVVPPGGYVVLGNNGNAGTNGGIAVDFPYSSDDYFLANGADEIVLDCSGVTIDRVEYDGGAMFPDPTGASMSLKPANLNASDNDTGGNWCTSTTMLGSGDFGTPGGPNSCS